jgi:hypothetical protein
MKNVSIFAIFALTTFVAACGGGTDEDGITDTNDVYVAEEGQSGRFWFDIEDDDIDVGDETVFKVRARDQNGGPASDVYVECYREEGLGFVEGQGLTDDHGTFSGVVRCVLPGSWRIQCSSFAAGWQEYRTIRCR